MTYPSNDQIIQQSLQAQIPGLTPSQVEKIAAISRERFFHAGQSILQVNASADNLYLVIEGSAILQVDLTSMESNIKLSLIGPREFLGWSAVVPPYQWTATVNAATETRAIAIDGLRLRGLLESDQSLGLALLRCLLITVSTRLRDTRREMANMFGFKST